MEDKGTKNGGSPGMNMSSSMNPPTAIASSDTAPSRQQAAAGLNRKPTPAPSATQRQYLPPSAPVSSLLPPIPTSTATSAVQSQLLALLSSGSIPTNAAATSSLTAIRPPPPAVHAAPSLNFSGAATANDPARLLAAQTAAASAGGLTTALATAPNMQNWSLEQLENHVKLRQQLQQAIPQNVSILLAEARRREDKRHAKRLANRKSASTSRARKKALVKEMTELNARLKRQALILSLLPDLVIVISTDGVVTFCSAQVERVLRHKIDNLVGSKLTDILVPSSKNKLENLIKELVEWEKTAAEGGAEGAAGMKEQKREREDDASQDRPKKQPRPAAADESSVCATANTVSDPSFPLSVVKVDAANASAGSDENDNSDMSGNSGGCKQISSLTASGSLPRSPTASSLGNSGSDDAGGRKEGKASRGKGRGGEPGGKEVPSSDTSNTSSLSTNAKKLQKANANLERNVRWHNKMKYSSSKKPGYSFKDDVVGEDVTANNATARLSSLQHRMESSSEEDSGYRESNDSREETSSSDGDLSDSNGRRKPMAPTCNICLIRDDQSTIWCEVTSSIRTRNLEDEIAAITEDGDKKPRSSSSSRAKSGGGSDGGAPTRGESAKKEGTKELLLCLRPIRDGEVMPKKHRFVPSTKAEESEKKIVSEGTNSSGDTSADLASTGGTDDVAAGVPPPLKKPRVNSKEEGVTSTAKNNNTKESEEAPPNKATDQEVVQSLMISSKKGQ